MLRTDERVIPNSTLDGNDVSAEQLEYKKVQLEEGESTTAVDAYLEEESQEQLFQYCLTQQMAIAFVFENKYSSQEDSDEEPWADNNGIYTRIQKDLNLKKNLKNSSIKAVLDEVIEMKKIGEKYDPRIKNENSSHKPTIALDS